MKKHNSFMFKKNFGHVLKGLREERNLSMKELERISDIYDTQICRWERGDNMLSVQNLIILANVLDVSVDEILTMCDEYEEKKDDQKSA